MRRGLRAVRSLFLKGSAILLLISLLLGLGSPYINPYNFWPAAFFGLAFPVVWILSLGLTILIIKRNPWFYIMLSFVLVASPMMLNHVSLPFKSNKSKPDDYKIVTYNVHGFSGTHEGKTKYEMQKQVIDFINEIGPSVVCLQEYAMKTNKYTWYQDLNLNDLKIPYKQISDFSPDGKGTNYCLMIASTFLIKQKGVIYTPAKDVLGMYADIQFPIGVIRVYNIHLESVKLIGEKKLLRPHKNLGVFKDILANLKGMYRKLKYAFSAQQIRQCRCAALVGHVVKRDARQRAQKGARQMVSCTDARRTIAKATGLAPCSINDVAHRLVR